MNTNIIIIEKASRAVISAPLKVNGVRSIRDVRVAPKNIPPMLIAGRNASVPFILIS